MTKLKFILFTFSLLLGSSLHSQNSIWKLFENEQYSLQFPVGWKVQEITSDLKDIGIQFMAMSDKEDEKDSFRENLNVLVENLKDVAMDLNTYAQKSEDAIKKSVVGLKMFNRKMVFSGSNECCIFQYHGKSSNSDLFWFQAYWIKDSKAYVLTLTSDEKSHWDFKRAFEVIAQSFTIK